MPNAENDGRLKYTKIDQSSYRVGTNPADDYYDYGDGAIEGKNIKGTITIPDTFNNLPVNVVSGKKSFISNL